MWIVGGCASKADFKIDFMLSFSPFQEVPCPFLSRDDLFPLLQIRWALINWSFFRLALDGSWDPERSSNVPKRHLERGCVQFCDYPPGSHPSGSSILYVWPLSRRWAIHLENVLWHLHTRGWMDVCSVFLDRLETVWTSIAPWTSEHGFEPDHAS